MSTLLHLGKCITSRSLGVEHFQSSWTYQVSHVFPLPAFVSLVCFQFLTEHVTDLIRLLVALCWMWVPCLPTVLYMLKDTPHYCPIVGNPVMDVLIAQVLWGLPLLHLTLWLLRDVLHRWGFSSSISHAVAWVTQASTKKVYQQCGKDGWVAVLKSVPSNAISGPKLADLFIHFI